MVRSQKNYQYNTLCGRFVGCPFIQYLICSAEKQLTRFWSKLMSLIENEIISEAKSEVKSDHFHISLSVENNSVSLDNNTMEIS